MKKAKFLIKETGAKKANPLIFGHFIEFMRDCIDEGMWAELLKNRGFDRKKEIPEGVVDGNPNVAESWYRTGGKNAFEIALDQEHSLAKDGFSQKITCYNDYDGYVGLAQGALTWKKEVTGGICGRKPKVMRKLWFVLMKRTALFLAARNSTCIRSGRNFHLHFM